MSVLCPDLKVFQYVQTGFIKAAYNRTCDDLYSYTISARVDYKNGVDEESIRWIKNLILLNEKSYAARYREQLEFSEVDLFEPSSTIKLNACQLLKYMQCIDYNIEMSTIEEGYSPVLEPCIKFEVTDQDKKDVELLQLFIHDIQRAIVEQLPEYKDAKYAD